MTQNVKFGFQDGKQVALYDFCRDPDGSGLQWYTPTGVIESLKGREQIGQETVEYDGRCSDTAEHSSHMGELVKRLVTVAPEGTTLVALVDGGSSVGTRTFSERLIGHFYR